MKNIIHFEPLTPETYSTYIAIGIKAYNQHYSHLWYNGDSSPYILNSFTEAVLLEEEKDNNTILFLIHFDKKPVGIIKITLNKALGNYADKEALFIDKIYILNEFTGKGIGEKALQFILLRAKELHKELVWLDAMQKSPALAFYHKNSFTIHSETKHPSPKVKKAESPMYILTMNM